MPFTDCSAVTSSIRISLTRGSNWLPEQHLSSANACAGDIALRWLRSLVIAQ